MIAVKKITVALAGNPNSGKTTIFNNLTGARQHVGNYPGVTIEKKEGSCSYRGAEIQVVDLPGTYSLTAFSPEEVVARRFLVEEAPDAVVAVLDAANLERNLYLAMQLLELEVPLILDCNMMDLVTGRGDRLDLRRLSAKLGVPVVATVGNQRQGMEELREAVAGSNGTEGRKQLSPRYSEDVEASLAALEQEIQNAAPRSRFPARWTAIKLLENDPAANEEWRGTSVAEFAEQERAMLEQARGEPAEMVLAAERYALIGAICADCYWPAASPQRSRSDAIDAVVTHRALGLPIFLAAMFAVFWATFNVGAKPSEWIEVGVAWLGGAVSGWWPAGSESPLQSLLVDGIIGGVGNVFVFLPNILILFFAIAMLEDSGYMPRAAFIMDRIMHKIGLHGKSFIPLLLGFGCTVPAIMATRTLESRRDRLTAILVAPLMSCGARLPIYSLILPAFFPQVWQAPLLWGIYVLGIVLAVVMAKLLRLTLFKGEPAPFVMELPPYRVPSLRDGLLHTWERSRLYLKKAGTIIMGISILLWALTNFPKPPAGAETGGSSELAYSYAGRAGHLMEPVLAPMGFDWKIGTALVGAFAAKEVFVAQMGIVYAVGEGEEAEAPLREQLRNTYPPLVGFCIVLFCLIGTPCMTTLAVTRREGGEWRWALLQFGGLTVLAYVVTAMAYQMGRLYFG